MLALRGPGRRPLLATQTSLWEDEKSSVLLGNMEDDDSSYAYPEPVEGVEGVDVEAVLPGDDS